MSTGDHTAHPPDSQDRDNDDLRFRRPQRNGQAQNMAYQSRIPTLSPRNGAQSRVTFSNTRTLKGAFQAAAAASPPPPPTNDDHEVKTPPRRLMAEVSSPPPDELIETYQQINDADDLAEYVAQDHYDPSYDIARLDRTRSPSPTPGATRREDDYVGTGDTHDSSLSFSDISDESLRQKLAQHAMDQARLKRVTQRESPVFSKAKVGLKAALSFENLQRRNEEEALREDVEPSLNVPKTWGLRGRVSKDWLNKASRPNGNNHVDERTVQSTDQALEHDIDFTARSLQISDSPPVRNNAPPRNEIENFRNKPLVENRLGDRETERRVPQEQVRFSIEGDPIPNSPVTIYRETDRERQRHLSKKDPQELLRTLSRRESPSVASTPEQTPADNTLLNVKTPVVTGAWIDTPAPDRTAEPPQDTSLEIISPSAIAAQNHPRNRRLAATAKSQPEKSPEENPPPEKPPPEPQEDTRPKPKTKRASSKPLKKPKLPRSALEAVIEDAKSGNHGLLFGESTIDSLQELLDENSTILDSKPLIKSESSEEGEEEEDDTEDKASAQTDDAVVERLNKKLQSLVRSINATQTGLTSLERQIAKDASILLSRTTKQSKKPLHRHTDSSGDLHSDGRHYVTFPLPRLWYRHPDTNRLRPTRLSWIVLGFLTWYFAELVMCDYYCHPLYAATCERNCLDPNAPRMPLVIPTMLWRWSHLSVILNPVWTILVAGFRFIAQLLGLWDGFFDSPPGGEWPVVDYQQNNIPAHPPSFEWFESDMDMGMMQDEYI
ncbi:hypothetical protein EMPG_15445 [Blastomyces silverae]|uniref:Uncharacterized protein n=1 Tax=Blastomyces silverae TaxID=2060906 RepID=A0A0H1BDM0_9EURO|nr:hypothetical protein EMPG_15445 [Blastomyces silverae]